jgi:hypothetical protein
MLLIKVAQRIAHRHMKRGAPENTIANDAIDVTRPRYPSE